MNSKTLRSLALAASLCVLAAQSQATLNVILMIGDGMGLQHVNAGSYYLNGSAGTLAFEPYFKTFVKTRSLNNSVTDSAAAASALATGHKVNNYVISQDPSGNPYETVLEWAKSKGKKTGLVTTVPITHATPAGFGAHESDRNNLTNIGNDYLNSSRPNVLFGAGDPSKGSGSYWSSSQTTTAKGLGYKDVYTASQLSALDPSNTSYALGLFGGQQLTYEYDRTGSTTDPHLSQMATKALDLLSNDPDGFFLMVEGGMIDYAAHSNDIRRDTREVVEFNSTFMAIKAWMAGRTDTLLIVTADHETGGLTSSSNGAGNYPGASWTTTGHTGTNVPLYAFGANADLINPYIVGGACDNTDVYRFMMDAYNAPVPEPATILALGGGLVALAARRRRKF